MNTSSSNRPGQVVIAGGSGFLGTSLAMHLTALGVPVVVLSRKTPVTTKPWRYVNWDARTVGDWRDELNCAAGLVNLVGRSVDCIKTPDNKDVILRSRIEATKVLGEAMRQLDSPPPVWAQMSTAHIFGDPPKLVCTEESPPGVGFAPFVGRAWEEAFHTSALPSQRKVILRPSFVIGRDQGSGNGALGRLRSIVRWGLGGTVAHGNQGMSWIHELDMNRLFERALFDDSMKGMYIATAPQPVSQSVFMREMRKAMAIPIGLPAADWMVRLGARFLLRTDPELAIYGRYLTSSRLREEQFEFRFSSIRDALADLLS
jgi:uncharacterized protein